MAITVTVIGLGYLGATHAVAMAELGHNVIGIEADEKKLAALKAGRVPFFEPGLEEALQRVIKAGRITFQSSHAENSRAADAHFICVGTPQLKGSYAADVTYLYSAVDALAPYLTPTAVVAGKSTVPVGTAKELKRRLSAAAGFDAKLVWNPEFLREGTALEDSLRPDRIVIGVEPGDSHSEQVMRSIYEPILNGDSGSPAGQTPFLVMDVATSELVKVAANSFLATKISFINAMAEIAEASGADTVRLAEAIGMDARIGSMFLRNGIGFGGGCLPKDIRAFVARAEELGAGDAVEFLKDVDAVNLRRRERVVQLANRELGSTAGKKILMLGAAFKPDSDDLRDSPALTIALRLRELGAEVSIHDPMSLDAVRANHPSLTAVDDVTEAARDAELVILGTEWKQYREIDPKQLGEAVKTKTVIDGRNALPYHAWQEAGWRVIALGRNLEQAN